MPLKYLLIILFLCCSFSVTTAQTLLNADFEKLDSSKSTGLQTWNSRPEHKTAPDQQIQHSGRTSIRLQTPNGIPFSSFSQIIAPPSGTGTRKYRVSCYLKRDSVEHFAGMYVNVFAGNKSLFFDNMENRKLQGTADWAPITLDFFVDETVTRIQIGGLCVGRGTAWFDDFELKEIDLTQQVLSADLNEYLEKALDIIQNNALRRDSVDWPVVRKQAHVIATGSKVPEDCYSSIRYVLSKLGDRHSFLMPASSARDWANNSAEDLQKMPITAGEIVEGNYAYLTMPYFSSGDKKSGIYFADKLHDLLEELDKSKPKGWILDLRGNQGGNCWPMLAGIGPLLGEGNCGYFHTPNQKKKHLAWFYRAGKSGEGKATIAEVSRKPYQLQNHLPNLAVLTGPMTASSGEVVTVAFRKRPNTRSFGEPTAGLSTGNQNYKLSDGAMILLTTSVYADREMTLYGHKIIPDELVEGSSEENDLALKAAIRWLEGLNKK